RMREEAVGDERIGRLIGADVGAGSLESTPHADGKGRAEQKECSAYDNTKDTRQSGHDPERQEIIEQKPEHEHAKEDKRRKDDHARGVACLDWHGSTLLFASRARAKARPRANSRREIVDGRGRARPCRRVAEVSSGCRG